MYLWVFQFLMTPWRLKQLLNWKISKQSTANTHGSSMAFPSDSELLSFHDALPERSGLTFLDFSRDFDMLGFLVQKSPFPTTRDGPKTLLNNGTNYLSLNWLVAGFLNHQQYDGFSLDDKHQLLQLAARHSASSRHLGQLCSTKSGPLAPNVQLDSIPPWSQRWAPHLHQVIHRKNMEKTNLLFFSPS